jgi:cell division protein FtsW
VAPLPPPARRTGRGAAAAKKTWRERRVLWLARAQTFAEARLHEVAAWGARRFPRLFAAAENALGLSTADLIRPREVGVDRVLAGAVLALAAFGTVMVFSAGAVFAAKKYGDAFYFLKRQLVYLALGLAAMTVAVRTDYTIYRKLAYPMLFASILALAAVLKIGGRAGGAIRWFRLGPLSFQPSELAKFALCAYLATLLARKAEKVRVFSVGFLPPLVVTGVMMLLLLRQPDLGTAVIFGVVALSLLFVAGTRTSYILVAILVAAPAG